MQQNALWQLLMFQKALKKRLRLAHLKKLLTALTPEDECLLVTCGDNNGAMNYHLRELGGIWTWADLEDKSVTEMYELLGDKVTLIQHNHLPYPDNKFDRVISIDVHEHLKDPYPFTKELSRITKTDGQVIITVPGGDKRKLANIIKNAIGMTKEKYGHQRDGFSGAEIKELMRSAEVQPLRERTFSRFFTEMIELGLNFFYVTILAKKSNAKVEQGTIAPATKAQLKSVEKTYKLYSLVYPLFRLISSLDALLLFTKGYVIIVNGRKMSID